MPGKQQALFLETQGGNWAVKETDIPEPNPEEIRVQIHAIALNPLERKIQKLGFGAPFVNQFPAIVGLDSAGVVDKVGESVTAFSPGDRVWVP